MVKTKPNQKIKVERLKSTLDKLDKLEEKPKSELNLRESIYFLRDKLKTALKKGYSYQDLSTILQEQEILISAATLKQYLTDSKKKSRARKNTATTEPTNNQTTESSVNQIEPSSSQSKSAKNEIKVETNEQPKKAKLKVNSHQTKAKNLSGNEEDLKGDFNQH